MAGVQRLEYGPKGLLQSRAFWGIALTVLGVVLNRAGYEFTADKETIIDLVLSVVSLGSEVIGPILAMYGTVKRRQPIDGILPKFD